LRLVDAFADEERSDHVICGHVRLGHELAQCLRAAQSPGSPIWERHRCQSYDRAPATERYDAAMTARAMSQLHQLLQEIPPRADLDVSTAR